MAYYGLPRAVFLRTGARIFGSFCENIRRRAAFRYSPGRQTAKDPAFCMALLTANKGIPAAAFVSPASPTRIAVSGKTVLQIP
jgi:hypothetical protein